MKSYLLAIDVGTSGVKLLLMHRSGEPCFTVTQAYPTHYPAEGWAEQDPRAWWRAISCGVGKLLKDARVQAGEIGAIGVDGVSWTPVMLDATGHVLANTPLWYDRRATQACVELRERMGEERAFALSGNPIQPYYTLPKVMWFCKNRPDVMARTRHILSSNGYVVYRLTGAITQDFTQAYGWHFFDMQNRRWDMPQAQALGIEPDWLPPLCESSAVAGVVSAAVAEETGLCAGTPVVAGGLDAACGALGAGVIGDGPVHEQSGSAGGMSVCTAVYRPARGLILGCHVVPGRWLVQGGTVGGGGVMRWLQGVLYPQGDVRGDSLAELSCAAKGVAPGADGVLFLPYMAGERSPIWDPDAKGVYYGLDFGKGRGHLVRAAMEGAAFALRHNLDAARDAGNGIGVLHAVGGASRSELWMQIKADVTGHPIRAVDSAEATGMGCAILAGVGAGIYPGFEAACARLVRLGAPYMPQEESGRTYERQYERYLQLYRMLKDMMKGC